jgi:hypothetical protein
MHSAAQQEAWELVEIMDDRQLKSAVVDLRNEVCTLKVEIADDAIALRDTMRERDAAAAELATEREKVRVLRLACERLRDCDWVISVPDRMDAVREIAREALKKMEGEK